MFFSQGGAKLTPYFYGAGSMLMLVDNHIIAGTGLDRISKKIEYDLIGYDAITAARLFGDRFEVFTIPLVGDNTIARTALNRVS